MPVNFGIGVDDFAELIKLKATYIDKTLLIKELLQDFSSVILFPRPRRFGKTLALSMLKYFLDIKSPEPDKNLFENLNISQYPELLLKHQNKYPVIFISLKEVKKNNIKDAMHGIRVLIQKLFNTHKDLYEDLDHHYQARFDGLLSLTAPEVELAQSLQFLSELLEKKHGQKTWILIDEYDTPIHAAWEFGFYEELKIFMQGFLGSALKSNTSLYKGVLTGILRVSQEGMFSDLNNIMVHSMLSDFYSSYFGFTESEVDWICQEADVSDQREQVRDWYNGYKFGDLNIYNPWSIINFAKNKKLGPYWVNTGSSQMIEHLIARAPSEFKKDFEILIQGGVVTQTIDEKIVLPAINSNAVKAVWSFLLFSGYLKAEKINLVRGNFVADLKIPNAEILSVYENYFMAWFESANPEQSNQMLKALISGEIKEFEKMFQDYVEKTLSYFDVGAGKAESFYHALVLGMIVVLRDSHQILSNRESGFGRYDVLIIPKELSKLGIIIEFKVANTEKSMSKEAKLALAQIESNNYQAELNSRGINKILKLAIIFFGKKVLIKTK